jgi:hypothetical protein
LVWKGLRESLKLPNNNYSVLLMKHFQVYWQTCLSETIWWRYIFWGMYGIMDFFLYKVNVLRYCFFSGHAFFCLKNFKDEEQQSKCLYASCLSCVILSIALLPHIHWHVIIFYYKLVLAAFER